MPSGSMKLGENWRFISLQFQPQVSRSPATTNLDFMLDSEEEKITRLFTDLLKNE